MVLYIHTYAMFTSTYFYSIICSNEKVDYSILQFVHIRELEKKNGCI